MGSIAAFSFLNKDERKKRRKGEKKATADILAEKERSAAASRKSDTDAQATIARDRAARRQSEGASLLRIDPTTGREQSLLF